MPKLIEKITGADLLVRFVMSCIDDNKVYDVGTAHLLSSADAKRFIKGGIALAIDDDFGQQLARHEISLREAC